MIIHSTSAICNKCDQSHAAHLIRRENRILAVLSCPQGDVTYDISSDAEMFLRLREKSNTKISAHCQGGRFFLNYISITNACNFKCKVCGADAVSLKDDPVFLSVEEVCHRAEQVKKNGGRILHLIGGEPTLHPEILTIIKRLAQMGFSTGLVTNGYLLGTDDQLAMKYKQHGLVRVCLQFDSLSEATLNQFNRGFLKQKQNAIRNIIRAKLSLGLNCTATKHNLSEIKDLLVHGLELGNCVKNMTFGSAARIGRYEFEEHSSADREQIVAELLKAGPKYNFSFDDVFPLPAYLPWGIQIHPDCGVHICFIRSPNGIKPLGYYVDMNMFYRHLSNNKMKTSSFSKSMVPIYYLFRSVKKGKLLPLVKAAMGILFRNKEYSFVNVGISNYNAAAFLDQERIQHCASAFYTSVGPIKGCLHFFRNRSFPGSHSNEVLHGQC